MAGPGALPLHLAATAGRLIDRIRGALPEVQAVYAYGSRVRGGGHPASDLDLALLVPRQARFEPVVLLELRGDLELVAGCPVELAVLDPERGLVHCKEVVAHGATLYVGDRRAVDDFEMRVLAASGRVEPGLADKMRAMVGFRNVVIHEYQKLNLEILRSIVESKGRDLIAFCSALGVRIRPG